MKLRIYLFLGLIGLLLGLAVSPALAASADDFVEFGAIGDLFTTLFTVFLPIILILFVIDIFLSRILGYNGIFARVFKL